MAGKLFALKKWLSIADAAKRLSASFGEEVTEADIFRLALDGELRLSAEIYGFVHARKAEIVDLAQAKRKELPDLSDSGKIERFIAGTVFKDGEDWMVIEPQKDYVTIDGVFDLMMIGGERSHILSLYQETAHNTDVSFVHLDGSFVRDSEWVYCLYERELDKKTKEYVYYPMNGIPEYSNLVIRKDELVRFENSLNDADDKPLSNRERNTLLTIIAALCKEAKIDYRSASKAANLIQDIAASLGASIGESTIEGHLKKIPNAVESRMK